MRAEEAREMADQVQKSGVKDILEKIKVQALKGESGKIKNTKIWKQKLNTSISRDIE